VEDLHEFGRRLSNWGRWDVDGRRDERGTTKFGEILEFEELAEDCAADGRYEFLLTAPPVKFRRAVGSPINPLAIK
jgi:hypothetical protein